MCGEATQEEAYGVHETAAWLNCEYVQMLNRGMGSRVSASNTT